MGQRSPVPNRETTLTVQLAVNAQCMQVVTTLDFNYRVRAQPGWRNAQTLAGCTVSRQSRHDVQHSLPASIKTADPRAPQDQIDLHKRDSGGDNSRDHL